MVRPPSNNKAPKQRSGKASGKRKHGGAPHAGGSGGRPAKQSRREGRSEPVDLDVYEAEDSDPDEVKNTGRFDKVDNYEYELPSDFEDEEIDEELAFTEEDKKKFGAWFEDEVGADDGEEVVFGDADGDDWDEDDEGQDIDGDNGDDDEEPGSRRGRGRAEARRRVREDGGGGNDDDLFLGDDDKDDDDGPNGLEDDEGEEYEDINEDDERHRAMLRDILGTDARKRARRDPNAAVVSEAYPESEYNLNPGAASAGGATAGVLSVGDLIRGLTDAERRKLGTARRLLEKVAGAGGDGSKAGGKMLKPVPAPVPTIIAERQERKAGYEAVTKDVSKWTPLVHANRDAPTLRFVSSRDEVPRVTTTAALVAQHTPSTDNALESEVAALLKAAGVANVESIQEAEERLALKSLTLEEARERRDRLAKMRALLFYHEMKARRLKAIKSKEYHRNLARAAKAKANKLAEAAQNAGGDESNVDAARVAAIEAEFQRAKERLTLRHRNSSRWARRALKRGQLQMDAGTKAALAEQLQLGQQLKRKIEGKEKDGDDSDSTGDGTTSASDSEGGEAGGGGLAPSGGAGKVRSAALELLAGGDLLNLNEEDAPKKGLLALPFMKRAMERRRLAAKQEAEELLRELDEQQELQQGAEDGEENGRPGGGAAARGGTSDTGGLLESLVGYGVPVNPASGPATGAGGRRKFSNGAAANVAATEAADAVDKYVNGNHDSESESDDVEDAEAKAERLGRPSRAAAAAKKQPVGKGKKGRKGAPLPTAADEADLDAAIAAGAAGCGLLVTSADAGVSLAVDGGVEAAAAAVDDDPDTERRESGRRASTRAAGSGATVKGGILQEVAALQASLAAGGGRAALFGAAGDGGGTGAPASTAPVKFLSAKKFDGARPGYAFKKGPKGLGYYLDPKSAAAIPKSTAAGGGSTGVGKGKAGHKQGEGATVAGQPTQQKGAQKQGGKNIMKNDKLQQQQQKAEQKQQSDDLDGDVGGDDDGDDDDDEEAPMMRPAGTNQRDLIRQAFAGDDVEAEFEAEKAAAVAEEMPKIDEPSKLPGWGEWASKQRRPNWMKDAKAKAASIRAAAVAGRKDAKFKYVVISERYDKKAEKYTAPAAPFPFKCQAAYERSLRQPLGREYNPDKAFRDLTRPAVLKQAGVVIEPLRFSEPVAKDLGQRGKTADLQKATRLVMTIAGGMAFKGKTGTTEKTEKK